eukprot:jgi/Mesvir1/9746/Mv12209-RA.1
MSGGVLVRTQSIIQILAVLKSGSVEGLNPASFELETVGYAVHLTRAMGLGIHWTAYGELFMLLLQAVVLVLLIYGYGGNVGTARRIKVACFCVLAGAYLTGAIPPALIENVYHVSHILFISARVQQMAANYKAKATGQLSLSTNLMNTVGTLVRIFTTIQEGGDKSMLFGFVGGAVLNGIVVAQILTYGKKKTTKSKKIV